MKILVPVDGSPYTKRMLAYLVAHDEWLGDKHHYTVLHVAAQVPSRAAAVLDHVVLQAHYNEEAEQVFKPIRTFMGKQKIAAEFLSRVGPAAEAIASEASQGGYELLIMGSHGHGSLGNLVMGSVATQVLARCTTPLLLIR